MSGSNDGHSMQLWPYGQAAGQDKTYFPLGTCKAKPDATEAILAENERLRDALSQMLGSERAAADYMAHRRFGFKKE
jgi:hypothetical protein